MPGVPCRMVHHRGAPVLQKLDRNTAEESRADFLASQLGLTKVGWIFTFKAEDREHLFSDEEASLQGLTFCCVTEVVRDDSLAPRRHLTQPGSDTGAECICLHCRHRAAARFYPLASCRSGRWPSGRPRSGRTQ